MNTSRIGNVGEAKVLCKFVEMGIPVYLPYGDGEEIDMLAIFNNKINRIQVKTTRNVHDNGLIIWKLTKQEMYHGNNVKYDIYAIDYFALYCIEADVLCLFPISEAHLGGISMRLSTYSGKKLSTMHFVEDYSFEKIIGHL